MQNNQKSTIKDLNHQMHVDAKANYTAAVKAEDAPPRKKASQKEQKKESEKMKKKLEVVEREISDERNFNQYR